MKLKAFFAAALAAGMVLFSGCNQNQSEMNMDDLSSVAVVSGVATYNAGVEATDGGYAIQINKPVVGKKVFVEVPLAVYDATNKGTKIFETTTDANGAFSLEIPTIPAGIGSPAHPIILRLEEFTAEYKEFVKMENGQPVFKVNLYRYSYNEDLGVLKAGAYKFPEAIEYAKTMVDLDGFNYNVALVGNIQIAKETGYKAGCFVPAANRNIEFEITYQDVDADPDPSVFDPLVLTFGATTDAQGNYRLNVPAKSLKEAFTLTNIRAMGFGEDAFVHYTDVNTTETLEGAYELPINNGVNLVPIDIIEGVDYHMGPAYCFFLPKYDGNATEMGSINVSSYSADLAGWLDGLAYYYGTQYSGTQYNDKVTVTGTVKLATTTAYGEGAYMTRPTVITAKLPWLGYADVQVLTDANGNYAFDVPVANKTKSYPPVEINVANIIPDFTFYNKDNQAVEINDGKYTKYADVKPAGSVWNVMGVSYFKFTPTTNPDDWKANLAGWNIIKKDGYKDTVYVTGKVYKAIESAYGVGAYAPVDNEVVSVSFTDPDASTVTVDVRVDNGSFRFPVYMKKGTDVWADATLASCTFVENEFKHFYLENGSIKQTAVASQYNSYNATQITAKNHKWYEMGDLYFTLTTPVGATGWHSDLAGWVKIKDLDKTVKASGKVMLAVESSYGIGTYKAGANQIITIDVYGGAIIPARQFNVLVKADGSYTVDLPIKNTGDEYDLSMITYELAVDNFVHYPKKGQTRILEGKYGNPHKIAEPESAWNEMGTYYFSFLPSSTPSTWSSNLTGWIVEENAKFATVTGKVMLAVETALGTGDYVPAADKVVPVAVTTGGITKYFDVMTNANGEYSVDVPVTDEAAAYTANVNFGSNQIEVENFTHYYYFNNTVKTTLLKGKYAASANYVVKTDGTPWNEMGTSYLKFTPETAPSTWHANLIGWFKTAYDKTATVKGQAFQAVETAYAAGTYTAATNQIVTANVASYYGTSTNLDILVDANGEIKLDLPVKFDGDIVDVTMSGSTINNIEFAHYPLAGSSVVDYVKGKYTAGAPIKKQSDPWTELGTIYFKFTPNTGAEPDNWTTYFQYLAGWQKDATRTESTVVTGFVKLPEETGFRKGAYIDGKNQLVKIVVAYGSPTGNKDFVAATKEDGSFEVPVFCESESEVLDATWSTEALQPNTKNESGRFVHYYQAGTENTELLKGRYTVKTTLVKSSAKWNEKGTRYYQFIPEAGSATEWSSHLPGWKVRTAEQTNTISISGAVKVAIEEKDGGNWAESWTERGVARKLVVKIDLNHDGNPEDEFDYVTASNGTFSFNYYVTDDEKAADTNWRFQVVPADDTWKSAFTHYPKKDENNAVTTYGKFKSAGNMAGWFAAGLNGSAVKLYDEGSSRYSAKMYFKPDIDPENWSTYNWTSKYNEK